MALITALTAVPERSSVMGWNFSAASDLRHAVNAGKAATKAPQRAIAVV